MQSLPFCNYSLFDSEENHSELFRNVRKRSSQRNVCSLHSFLDTEHVRTGRFLSNVLYLPSGITVTISVLKRVLKINSQWLALFRGPVRPEFLLEIHQSNDIEIQSNR